MPTVDCLVCGVAVDPETAIATAVYDAQTYHFRSTDCRDAFVADPGSYVGNTGTSAGTQRRSVDFERL